jgi:hypothetical protein
MAGMASHGAEATHRLATAVIEVKPSNVAREAELLGKMKEIARSAVAMTKPAAPSAM